MIFLDFDVPVRGHHFHTKTRILMLKYLSMMCFKSWEIGGNVMIYHYINFVSLLEV